MPQKADHDRIVTVLLQEYGTTFAQDLGIDLKNEPSPLFCILMATVVSSTRISAAIAMEATRRLISRGWTTPEKLLSSTWEDRIRALNEAHYVRYDESRSAMLAEMAQKVRDDYGGDLRNLREKAGRDPARERQLLDEFKGIGPAGVEMFCREAQAVWDELFPTADEKALAPARKLGLPATAAELSRLVDRRRFPNLVTALVKLGFSKDYDRIRSKIQDLGFKTSRTHEDKTAVQTLDKGCKS